MQRNAGERGARSADEEIVVDDVKPSSDILDRQREHAQPKASAVDIETEANVICGCDVGLDVERIENRVEVVRSSVENTHVGSLREVVGQRADGEARRLGMVHRETRDCIDLADNGKRFFASLFKRAADAILRDRRRVDASVDADAIDVHVASARVIRRRLAQLDSAVANFESEGNRHGVDSLRRRHGRRACTGKRDVEGAVARTRDRQLEAAYVDARQAEAVAAARKKIAQRVPDRNAVGLQERLRATFDAKVAERGASGADLKLGDANVVSRERSSRPDGKTQQLVARSRHEPDDDGGGQQADCKALAHVSPRASIPFVQSRTPLPHKPLTKKGGVRPPGARRVMAVFGFVAEFSCEDEAR